MRRETYDPEWEEAFVFQATLPDPLPPAANAASAGPGPLRVSLLDWNRVGGPDKIGEVVLGSGRMWDVIRAPVGWEEERRFPVRRAGKVFSPLPPHCARRARLSAGP